MTDSTTPIRLSILLDRSGSMTSIAGDMVGAINQLFAEQRESEGSVLVNLAQFDSGEPFGLLLDGVPLREVLDIDPRAYQPRGMTPLFDAIGRMIGHVDAQVAGKADETDQVVAIVTDGYENASREFTRESVFELVETRRKDGWAFVFLGADQDSFAAGESMAFSRANRGDWDKTRDGTKKMMTNLSGSLTEHRSKPQAQRRFESDEFYREEEEGTK